MIGGLLYLAKLSDLNGNGLDERENTLERFSLAGLHPQQGTTMAKRSKLVFLVGDKKETKPFFL